MEFVASNQLNCICAVYYLKEKNFLKIVMPKMRENCKNGPFSILKIGVAQNACEIHYGFF